MTADPNRFEAIFAAARAKGTPEERAAYLDEACAGDAALRRRMEDLLQAHDDAGSFLERPAAGEGVTTDQSERRDRAAPRDPAEGPGTRIGPYKLLQQIGEGGMGVVYMAEQQEPLRRMVALKIIKPGMDSAQVVARFEAERQALALMDHQNIARVLDAGTTDAGRPFFVMELVKGIPLTRFCDENRLTPRARLELFIPVCQAVQHAHQKGVIHRDLKPTNVLVTLYDGRPVPKVIDFGVAKALHQKLTERTLFTAFGSVVGTLEYMSPEQAELNALDVDTRSDVYSLGVLLYELLTGTTPLERGRLKQAAYAEVLRLIREEEAPRPSTRLSGSGEALARISAQRKTEPAQLARLVRGELDWIVMKSLEKDRGRRYETASGLARDVERYLKDEPVEACPPSVGYRLSKFARKNRVVLSTVAAFATLLVIGAGISTWLAVQAKRAEAFADNQRVGAEEAGKQALHERDRADKAAGEATKTAAEVRQALDRLSVEQGLRLAENDDLFKALLWFAKPLERGGLSPEEERIHRTRFACYLRHTHGRPVLRQMLFHEREVQQVAFSPDATELLTATEEGASVWDLNTGRKIATLELSKGVEQLRFLEAKQVSGQAGFSTRIWDTTTGRLLDSRVMDSGPAALALSFVLPRSPSQALGSVAACELLTDRGTCSPDGRLHLRRLGNHAWLCDLSTGKLLHHWSFPGPNEPILHNEFSADARHVLISTAKQARVYDVRTSEPVGPALLPEGETGVQVSSDGSRVLLESSGRVTVWDVIAGKRAGPATAIPLRSAERPALGPDGRILALSEGFGFGWDGRFTLWDIDLGRSIAVQGDQDAPGGVRFSPDGSYIITGGKGRVDELWDVRAGRAAGPLLPNFGLDAAHEFSPDGSMVAVAHEGGIVRVWHLAGYRNGVREAPMHAEDLPHAIVNWSFTHRGPWATGISTVEVRPPPKRLSGLRESLKILPPSVNDADVFAVASPDGHRLVTFAAEPGGRQGSTALLWDVDAGRRLGRPIEHPKSYLTHVEFSGDSRFLVTASSPGPTRLCDARTGEPIGAPLQHGAGVRHAGFAANGSRLVTCGEDATAQVWDTATAYAVGPRLRHDDAVNRAALGPDGRLAATASSDGTARLWDAATGRPVGRALSHGYPLFDIAFDAKGRLLMTQGWSILFDPNYGFRIWDVATQQELSPNIRNPRGFPDKGLGATWDAEDLFVPEGQNGMKYDLRPDQRPAEDLVKLAQLHAGQRLDEHGSLAPLAKAELQRLWNQLRAAYPDEFTVRPEAAMAWHVERIETLAPLKADTEYETAWAIRQHRRGLARQMAAANWHEGATVKGLDWDSRPLYRLKAMAQFGRAQDAVATAEALAAHPPVGETVLYDFAGVHALAAAAVTGDATLSDRYAARAVSLLRQAAQSGFKGGERLLKDPDLDALRRRKDFLDFLWDLAETR